MCAASSARGSPVLTKPRRPTSLTTVGVHQRVAQLWLGSSSVVPIVDR
jgi:hypothetical protein